MCSENKKRDLDNATIDVVCNGISDDMLKLRAIITSTVLDSLNRLGSPSTALLNATMVPKISVDDWTHVKKLKK